MSAPAPGGFGVGLLQLHGNISPERHLWLAVLVQAVAEANANHPSRARARAAAVEWLTAARHGRSRRLVCELAGLDECELVQRISSENVKLGHWRERRGSHRVSLL